MLRWRSNRVVGVSNPQPTGAAVMTAKLNFGFIWQVSLSCLCSCITHIGRSDLPPVATTHKVSMDTDANFSPFYRSVDPRSTQTFMPQISFCFKSTWDITLSEFALDLAYTRFHTKASIFPTELLNGEASTPARKKKKRPDNHSKTHFMRCDCCDTAANQPSGVAYLFSEWKPIQRHLEALHFRTNGPVSRELRRRTQKSKYRIRLFYFTEVPPEVFFPEVTKWSKLAANVSSRRLLPAVGSDAVCTSSRIQ